MKKKLFSLSPNDKFILEGITYTVKRYINRNMPKIGKTLNLEAISENGKLYAFIHNWEVDYIDISPNSEPTDLL